ncbi:MAG: DNA polymerase III subunit delta [Erysipelotrichaceae bacterium]|nr:DNA polymerase III subunit delta [Erysipelotrichaceae bacterium]
MIRIIYGQEECFIREKLNELKKDDVEIIHFDGSDKSFTIQDMLEACDTGSLFGDKTLVLVKDPIFFRKKISDQETELLNRFINDPPLDSDLVLYTYLNNFDLRLKTYKMFTNNADVIVCNSLNQQSFNNYVRSRLTEEGLSLKNDAVIHLTELCKRNATLLNQNLAVLKLYPDPIDSDTIDRLCSQNDENDAFDLINALVDKNVSKAIYHARLMAQNNDSVLGILALLSNQLRFLYHVAYLRSINTPKQEILDITKASENRMYHVYKTLDHLSMEQIMKLLSDLLDLDIRCKSDSSLNDFSRLELLILNLADRGNYESN